tara:strand:+ start:31115 stop:31561 length:447 start_codon:yes stop_codon:yes gene_type:complete
MRTQRFHFVSTLVFSLGFVLAGSGWSFVLSSLMNDRPEWSVCGQAMCSCVMPTADAPECPLCEAGLMDPEDMPDDSGDPTRRVPQNNKSVEALGGAGTNVAIAFFVGTMIGRADAATNLQADRFVMVAVNDRVPNSLAIELPTPPPRG